MVSTVDVGSGLTLVNLKIFMIYRSAKVIQKRSHLAGKVCKSLREARTETLRDGAWSLIL